MVIIAALFSVTACSLVKQGADRLYVERDSLTEKEAALLKFVGPEEEVQIFQFSLDDHVKSMQINIYELRDGKWHLLAGGGGSQLNNTKGRIALTFDDIGTKVRYAVEGMKSSVHRRTDGADHEPGGGFKNYLSGKKFIEYDVEIPLAVQVLTGEGTFSEFKLDKVFAEPENYTSDEFKRVYAITCMFSTKTVGELSKKK